jgi:hypothetical protein
MSRKNGDKSRFHRQRKQRIERRMRQRKLFSAGGLQPTTRPADPSKRYPHPVREGNAQISLTKWQLEKAYL